MTNTYNKLKKMGPQVLTSYRILETPGYHAEVTIFFSKELGSLDITKIYLYLVHPMFSKRTKKLL